MKFSALFILAALSLSLYSAPAPTIQLVLDLLQKLLGDSKSPANPPMPLNPNVQHTVGELNKQQGSSSSLSATS